MGISKNELIKRRTSLSQRHLSPSMASFWTRHYLGSCDVCHIEPDKVIQFRGIFSSSVPTEQHPSNKLHGVHDRHNTKGNRTTSKPVSHRFRVTTPPSYCMHVTGPSCSIYIILRHQVSFKQKLNEGTTINIKGP